MGTAPVEINAGSDATVLSWVLDADPGTVQQAQRTARSPVVSGPLALMPDAHVGVGSTIGSVIPTEAAIIPAAVGVDLGCGMSAIRTTHTASQLPDDLHSSLDAIANAVPAGFESHDEATPQARDWLRANPLPDKKAVANKAKEKMGIQLGTLGGGNHFIELSLDNDDNVWVVLHSGSRGIGNMLATSHIKTAQKTCKQQGRDLEDNDLAYFTDADDGFAPYVADMLWAQSYAKANRKLMADAVLRGPSVRHWAGVRRGRPGGLPPQLRGEGNPPRQDPVDHPQGRHPGGARRPGRHTREHGRRHLHRHRQGLRRLVPLLGARCRAADESPSGQA